MEFQGTLKEINTGTLEKELNGKEASTVIMLKFNGVELRELPGCYSAMSPLSVSLLVNLICSRALLMTAVCMTHALNYLCFCIYFVYGIIWITYVPTLILSLLDNIDCQIGEYENLA